MPESSWPRLPTQPGQAAAPGHVRLSRYIRQSERHIVERIIEDLPVYLAASHHPTRASHPIQTTTAQSVGFLGRLPTSARQSRLRRRFSTPSPPVAMMARFASAPVGPVVVPLGSPRASRQLPRCSIAPMCGAYLTIRPAKTTLTMLISLIRMFRLGPEVSLNGSPTVSPTTPAL